MAPSYSKYLSKNNLYAVSGVIAALWFIYKTQKKSKTKFNTSRKHEEEEIHYMITQKTQKKKKAQINRKFFKQLRQLLQIGIPKWLSPEIGYMFLVALSLIGRSACDVWTIHIFSKIESTIILMDQTSFIKHILEYGISMPLVSIINNMLKFAVGELKIHLRTNVTNHLYDYYLNKFTCYHMSNLDNRIANPDQLLTTDIDKFCECLTELYCNVAKPLLDIIIYVSKLNANLGFSSVGIMIGYLMLAGCALTYIRKPIAQLTVNEQKLEGEFRHVNGRIITYSEEIAFYQGNLKEKMTVLTSFNKLMAHIRKFLKYRIVIGFCDNIIAKYFALSIASFCMSIPFLYSDHELTKLNIADRTKLYYENGYMMVSLGQAIGRLTLAGRDLTKLAGYSVRVTELQDVLIDLNDGKYKKDMVADSEHLVPHSGRLIFKNNIIKFDKVPVVTPNGDVLIKELSVEIFSGMNVLVCGPNGAGKSSIFRILGELWPLFGGVLTKPPRGKLFYVPQKPYMTLGNLRDQIIYPHSGSEAIKHGCNDYQLEGYLKKVQLEYLLEREGGFDAVEDWLEVLSGGEKQRIAMARLFYHAPEFAILDECTSAVALDVEESMYMYCKEVGITLLTVSHRKSLWKHHEYALYLDGRGSYSFKPIEEDTEQFGS